MKTFDVRIESERTPTLRFRIAGDSWVSAWHEALAALGHPGAPADASCTVEASTVIIDIASEARRFVLDELTEPDPRVTPGRPSLIADSGELVPVHLVAAPEPRTSTHRRRTDRGAPRSVRAGDTPSTAPDHDFAPRSVDAHVRLPRSPHESPCAPAPDWRRDANDPLARVLSALERERLASRPVRINPQTGLPTPVDLPPARTPSHLGPRPDTVVSQRVPGPASDRRVRIDLRPVGASPDAQRSDRTAREGRRRRKTPHAVPRLSERAITNPGFDTPTLPHQFRPVMHDSEPPSGRDLLSWAADLAWQNVPCALTLVLAEREGNRHEIIAARGLREREVVGGQLTRDGTKSQLLCRVANRIRYAHAVLVAIDHPETPEGGHLTLSVDSAMCVPIPDEEGPTLSLLLLNASRPGGFTDGESRTLAYLSQTVADHLTR